MRGEDQHESNPQEVETVLGSEMELWLWYSL